MDWTEEEKGTIDWTDLDVIAIFTRKVMGDWTRAELAIMIKGDPTATITRKDIEDYFKQKPTIDWTEETKGEIEWTEETK